jgi:hypothetical protein
MMTFIKDMLLTATSFLSNNKTPPGTPAEDVERLQSINHLESKKFYIVLSSVLILSFFYFTSIGILFLIPNSPEIVSGFVTMFSKTTEILAVVIASYVGAQAVVDLKYNSNSTASLEGKTETINEVTVIHTNAKEEDYEIK